MNDADSDDFVDVPPTCVTVLNNARAATNIPTANINVNVDAAPFVQTEPTVVGVEYDKVKFAENLAKGRRNKERTYKRFLGKFIVAEQRTKWAVSTPTSRLNQTLEEGTSGFQLGGNKGDLPIEALLAAAREAGIPIPSMEGVLNYDAWYTISHQRRASSFAEPLSKDKEAMHFLGKLEIPAETKSHDDLKAEREGEKSRGKMKTVIPAKRDRAEEAVKHPRGLEMTEQEHEDLRRDGHLYVDNVSARWCSTAFNTNNDLGELIEDEAAMMDALFAEDPPLDKDEETSTKPCCYAERCLCLNYPALPLVICNQATCVSGLHFHKECSERLSGYEEFTCAECSNQLSALPAGTPPRELPRDDYNEGEELAMALMAHAASTPLLPLAAPLEAEGASQNDDADSDEWSEGYSVLDDMTGRP